MALASQSPAAAPKITRLGQLRKEQLVAPERLAEAGVSYYDFTITPSATVLVNLYNDTKTLKSSVIIQEDFAKGSFVGTIRPVGAAESWVRVDRVAAEDGFLYSISGSAGKTLNVRIAVKTPEAGKRVSRVEGIQVSSGSDWRDLGSGTASPEAAKALDETIGETFFATEDQKTLRVVFEHLEGMLERAVSRAPKAASTFVPVHAAAALPGCTVNCFRVAMLLPLYQCDGGWAEGCNCSAGSGLFLISGGGCGYFSCSIRCSDFPAIDLPDNGPGPILS